MKEALSGNWSDDRVDEVRSVGCRWRTLAGREGWEGDGSLEFQLRYIEEFSVENRIKGQPVMLTASLKL